MTFAASVELQGRLVKVRTNVNPAYGLNASTTARGEITQFSRRSRNRLIQLFARLNKKLGKPVFITLTYPSNYPDPKVAKRHLDTLWKRIARAFPKASAIWRMEFQRRGAPHFHLIVFGLPFLRKEKLQKVWGEIIGYDKPFTRIEMIRGFRHLMAYVSKYVAKVGDSGGGFNSVPYLTDSTPGRFWGIMNRACIPYADLTSTVLPSTSAWAVIADFKRAARRHYKKMRSGMGGLGFFLLVDDIEHWQDYLEYLIQDQFLIRRCKIRARS